MMRIYFAIIFAALQALNTPAMAQNEALNADLKLTSELAELKLEKLAIETKFKTLEAACYKKFAVSNCLQEVKTEKLRALGDVKRRELAINDVKRQLKADEVNKKSKKLAEKDDVPASVSDASKPAKSEKPSRSKNSRAEPASKDQNKLSEQRALVAQQRVLESNKKQAESQKKAMLRDKKLTEAEAKTAKFSKKLLEAEAHKKEIEKAKAEKTKPKSAPLPIPSAEQIKS